MALLEKRGVPTASLVSKGFQKVWEQSARGFGLAALPMALTDQTFTNASPGEIEHMVDLALDRLVVGITQTAERQDLASLDAKVAAAESVAVEGEDLLDAFAAMNELFLQNEWGDGFPIIPPTERAVSEALRHTKRDPHEIIAVLEPSFGLATVERIAINGVMAGCKPEYLPILIAAVKAVSQPRFMLRDAAVSTGGRAPLLMINGPIVERLGINSGVCALGPGAPSRANIAIGRALRLIYMNIGGSYPGATDPNTIGLPTKFSLCVAENEQQSPWDPYHVEMGYARDVSTVTVKSVYGCTETLDVKSTSPERIADVAVSAAKHIGNSFAGWLTGGTTDPDKGLEVYAQHMWLICPDHAAKLASNGWSKDDVKEYLWKNATIAFGEIASRRWLREDAKGRWVKHPELQWMEDHPDLQVPMFAGPESFRLAVVGGPGPRGVYFWGNEEAITQAIDD
jgi:hypothetical protein